MRHEEAVQLCVDADIHCLANDPDSELLGSKRTLYERSQEADYAVGPALK